MPKSLNSLEKNIIFKFNRLFGTPSVYYFILRLTAKNEQLPLNITKNGNRSHRPIANQNYIL